MPANAMRRDPTDPSKAQPLTAKLLKKVLARNYYEVSARGYV